jgi:putative salt-induced outer membrane protein YdiY
VDGYKYYGTPELTEDEEVRITRRDAVVSLEKSQVVRITPIEKTFWSRINGSVNFGVSYTKGSRIGRMDFSFDINYREEKNYIELKMTSNLTAEEEKESIQRSEASLSYQRLFQRKLYSDVTGASYRNDELGIALRLTLGAGLGAHLVQTQSHVLESTLGLSINREWAIDPMTPPTNNLEGVISLGYNVFKYNTPKTDLSSSVTAFPRLPDFDRWRVDVNVSLTQEIVSDFTIVFTFYDNFNSEPPTEGTAKNDWGFTTSFGYKF